MFAAAANSLVVSSSHHVRRTGELWVGTPTVAAVAAAAAAKSRVIMK